LKFDIYYQSIIIPTQDLLSQSYLMSA